jgi:hypothetical protein
MYASAFRNALAYMIRSTSRVSDRLGQTRGVDLIMQCAEGAPFPARAGSRSQSPPRRMFPRVAVDAAAARWAGCEIREVCVRPGSAAEIGLTRT